MAGVKSERARRFRRNIGQVTAAAAAAAWRIVVAPWRLAGVVRRAIGREELTVGAGVALIAVSLWPTIGWLALLPAGVILVWLGLPARTRFIAPPESRRERRHDQ